MNNASLSIQKMTASMEDYLETIYLLLKKKQVARAVDIANELGVKKSSVTEALQSLAKKGLVNYMPYKDITLSAEGEKTAKQIFEKHKALCAFFSDVLGVEKSEAIENACQIEHVISENAMDKLVKFIEFSNTYCKNKNMLEEFQKFCKYQD